MAVFAGSDALLERFERTNAARERALAETRQIVRLSANAIRAVHRDEYAVAEGLVAQAGELMRGLHMALVGYPNLYWTGYVQDAHKEFVEAQIVLALVAGRAIPGPEALGVADPVYLNGLGEAAGELRRYALDALRRGVFTRAEELLGEMDDIYSLLVTIDYPDALTGGLRRTTDMVRGVLERTRADVTLTLQQQQLMQALDRVQGRLSTPQ